MQPQVFASMNVAIGAEVAEAPALIQLRACMSTQPRFVEEGDVSAWTLINALVGCAGMFVVIEVMLLTRNGVFEIDPPTSLIPSLSSSASQASPKASASWLSWVGLATETQLSR